MTEKKRPPIKLEEMITHDELLERYPWLSGHSLSRWRQKRGLRVYRGAQGALVYSIREVEMALTADLNEEP